MNFVSTVKKLKDKNIEYMWEKDNFIIDDKFQKPIQTLPWNNW